MNWKKISCFLGIAFAWSWFAGLLMYGFDLDLKSIWGLLLVGGMYMSGPAVATFIVQKLIYKEPLSVYGLRMKGFNPWWLLHTIGLFLFAFLSYFGLVYLFGDVLGWSLAGQLNFGEAEVLAKAKELVISLTGDAAEAEKVSLPASPMVLFWGSILLAIASAFSGNLLFMFGEELGWRGLLLGETQSMGYWSCNLFVGFFWGLWHMPIILQGHNYPNTPVLGVVLMIVFCIIMSFLFSYVRLRSGNLLAPCVLHGCINGSAQLCVLFVAGGHELVSSIVGLLGMLAFLLAGLLPVLLFDRGFVSNFTKLS